MAKLRHVAMSVPDPAAAAKFYCEAFEMEIVGLYYEMKFRDPNGIIFDISHNGWVGAKK
jgi:catechol-2,3-dioxygenase